MTQVEPHTADHLFSALAGGGQSAATLSLRSVGTAEEVTTRPTAFLEVAVLPPPHTEISSPAASPGPLSTVSASPPLQRRPAAERSTRYHQASTTRLIESRRKPSSLDGTRRHHVSSSRVEAAPTAIVSERAAIGVTGPLPVVSSLRPRRAVSPVSATISSASDLSEVEQPRHKRRRHRRHHSVSSSSSSERPAARSKKSKRAVEPPVPVPSRRASHRRKAERASSTSSSSSEDSHQRRRRRRRAEKEKAKVAASAAQEEQVDECGRCAKPRMVDPLDPAIGELSAKKRERIREEIIRRIQRLKRNNPNEDIRLPSRGITDPVVCYRRYRRIARHLYAKRSISSYQLIVFVFTLIVQVVMSIMFGPAAAEYLKREYEQISKYDGVFYEMGCRAYSPYSSPQSPEYRFALQLISPIVLIAGTYFIGRYTPIPPMALSLFNTIATAYLKNQEVTEYRTLLHDEDNDEPDEKSEDDDSDDEVPVTAAAADRPSRGPRIHIPDLEAELPAENVGASAIQAAVPSLVSMITSLRAQPEGAATDGGAGMIGTLMTMAQAFMGGKPMTMPGAPAPAAAAVKPAPGPVMYAD